MVFDYTDSALSTSLIRAVINCDEQGVQQALAKGFHANLPDNRGWTPIHEAASDDKRIACLRTLVSHNSACINSLTFRGETALYISCENGCLQSVELLLNKSDCDVNISNLENISPLHAACNNKQWPIVKMLIDRGASVNTKECNGYTPLHEATSTILNDKQSSDDEVRLILSYLLSHGADPSLTEYEGNLPLHFACHSGYLKCVKLLLEASGKQQVINNCNSKGYSPFMMAVKSQNTDLLKYLLSQGADASIFNKSNTIALHIASHTGNFEVFSLVLQATSSDTIDKHCVIINPPIGNNSMLTLTDRVCNNHSIICLAIDTEDLEFVNNVLESGINFKALECPLVGSDFVTTSNLNLLSPISFLLKQKMFDLGERTIDFIKTLISHGLPLHIKDNGLVFSYVNPLQAALCSESSHPDLIVKCLRVLIEYGADPDYRTCIFLPSLAKLSAIELACKCLNKEAVLLLLQESNSYEPEHILRWIERNAWFNQYFIVEALLPLAPYYVPGKTLIPDVKGEKRAVLLAPKVHSLSSYCRCVIRRELHRSLSFTPLLFKKELSNLPIPNCLIYYLSYK